MKLRFEIQIVTNYKADITRFKKYAEYVTERLQILAESLQSDLPSIESVEVKYEGITNENSRENTGK